MKRLVLFALNILFVLGACSRKTDNNRNAVSPDTLKFLQKLDTIPEIIDIEKDFLYYQYTLADTYPYKDTVRIFQWDKIRKYLQQLERIRKEKETTWGILQNYKNLNGQAPLVRTFKRDKYNRMVDSFNVERYQSVPLYLPGNTTIAERYGRDGSLVRYISDSAGFMRIAPVEIEGEWLVPVRYLKLINDTIVFDKTIVVDRTNQNIATLAKVNLKWLVRSMNPATTGLNNPPFERETPLGIFVIQEKKEKMYYYKFGTTEIEGFAPYANRFCNGGYIHGVPVNEPQTELIEFSPTLGTTPRSHMCVRNATSHAKFVYDWASMEGTIVFVFD